MPFKISLPKLSYDVWMALGNCYECHVDFLHNEVDDIEQEDWILCHGTVTNAAGDAIEHCWLESNGMAYDFSNGNRNCLDVHRFREITKARDITEYSTLEVSANVVKHRHYGPWK